MGRVTLRLYRAIVCLLPDLLRMRIRALDRARHVGRVFLSSHRLLLCLIFTV